MTSKFDCLGFDIKNEYEYEDIIRMTAENGESLPTPSGGYLSWQFGNGIELWALLNERSRLAGLNPHFRGNTTQILALSRKINHPESALDGAFEGWANPQIDRTVAPVDIYGDYPLVFDSPAFDWFQNLDFPMVARVQLVGFGLTLDVQNDDENYRPVEIGSSQLAKNFFIPIGTFKEAEGVYPESIAWIGGKVLSCKPLYNTVSKQYFTMATLRSWSMDLDIVIPQGLLEKPLAAGQIIHGNFQLSGMIQEILETFDGQTAIQRGRLFLQTQIAGTQYQDIDETAKKLRFGDRLQLEREPRNHHDKNAIAVYTTDSVKLGYIPKSENYALAKIMDSGSQPPAHIVEKNLGDFDQIIIRVYLPPDPGDNKSHQSTSAAP